MTGVELVPCDAWQLTELRVCFRACSSKADPPRWTHLPNGQTVLEAKKTRAIGVSNYGAEHLKQMNEYAKVKPAVNQIEVRGIERQSDTQSYPSLEETCG